MWLSPSLRVKWGPYFDLDTSEKMATVAFAQAALGGVPEPLITKRQAVETIAPVVGIDNVDAAMTALEEEAQQKADEAAKRFAEQQKVAAAGAQTQLGAQEPTDPNEKKPNAPV